MDPKQFEGFFVTEWDGLIRRIAYDDVTRLLELVREHCPNALIMCFGYFTPFSYASSMQRLRTMAKEFRANDLLWAVNEVFGFKDVDSILLELTARSVWATGRAQYWQKQAVMRASMDPAVRGPGILFIPSGFAPENSVFGSAPLLHEDYTHRTVDDLQSRREQECPRLDNLPMLDGLRFASRVAQSRPSRRELIRIRDDLTGPMPLIDRLTVLIELLERDERRGGRREDPIWRREVEAAWWAVSESAREDASRIQRTLIASFIHPNTVGARRYADIATQRYAEYVRLADQIRRDERQPQVAPPPPGSPETLSNMLRRYGLRGQESLLVDIGHLDVDSLGVFAVTARDSDRLLVPNIYLVIDTKTSDGTTGQRQYQLNMPIRRKLGSLGDIMVKKFYPEFEPATSHQFTVDPGEPLRLSEIVGVSLTIGEDDLADWAGPGEHGSIWRPRRVILEINGCRVYDQAFRNRQLSPGQTLRFTYPPKPPKEPGVARTRISASSRRSERTMRRPN